MLSASKMVTLGDVCHFVGGGTPARDQPDFYSGDIPWATVKDFKSFTIFDTQEHVTQEAVDRSASNIVEPGTVLLVTRVGLGKVAMAGRRLAINQDVKGLTPRADVLPEYLFWFLVAKAPTIERMGVGATVKGVTLHDIKAIKMPLPNKADQQRIVALLLRAENIVRMRREAEAKAKEIIPALFLDMFGDLATNPRDGSDAHDTNHEGRREVIHVATLGDSTVVQIIDGDRGEKYPKKFEFTTIGDCLFLNTSNVRQGSWDFTKCDFISKAKDRELRKGKLRRDDVVLTTRGTLGHSAHYDADIPFSDVRINSGMVILRANTEVLLPEYLLGVVNSGVFAKQVQALTSGSAQPQLPIRALSKITFPIPPVDSQRRFVMRFKQARDLVASQDRPTAQAAHAFQSLLAGAFPDARST